MNNIDTWQSGANWYRKWPNGWIEQGGTNQTEARSNNTYNLHVPFSDTNYTLIITANYLESGNDVILKGRKDSSSQFGVNARTPSEEYYSRSF